MKFLFDANMATILVGPQADKFVVHQALLCNKSEYFTKALTGSFEEGKTKIVKLEDVSPVLFRIMVTWLYTGKIVYTVVADNSNIGQDFASLECMDVNTSDVQNHEDTSTWPKQVLIGLYVLADRLDIKELKNNAIDALRIAIDKSGTGIRTVSYGFIDSNTTVESTLRKLAVDTLVYSVRHSIADQGFWNDIPQNMATTALLLKCQTTPSRLCTSCYQKGLSRNGVEFAADHPCKTKDKRPFKVDPCIYHEHANDEEKKACQASRDMTVKK